MFTAIPTLTPQDTRSPWLPSVPSYSIYSTTHVSNHRSALYPNPAGRGQSNPPSRTPLGVLRTDEAIIDARKANIRRFGATWLKPPGIGKTLQGMWDERAEREEQEAAQAREQALADAQAAAAAEAEAEARNAMVAAGEDEEVVEERDLDDDIPEADDGNWIDDDGEDAMPTEEGDGDYAEDVPPAQLAGDIEERDLDDDVPEAGSYQHTDTDLEDESSFDEEAFEAPVRTAIPGNVSAGVLASSAFGSSPVENTAGRRSRGNTGRGRGREN